MQIKDRKSPNVHYSLRHKKTIICSTIYQRSQERHQREETRQEQEQEENKMSLEAPNLPTWSLCPNIYVSIVSVVIPFSIIILLYIYRSIFFPHINIFKSINTLKDDHFEVSFIP